MINKTCLYVSQEEGKETQEDDKFNYVITKTKKPIDLIPGKTYKLKYTGKFCHIAASTYKTGFPFSNEKIIEDSIFTFIGEIEVRGAGKRRIFYASDPVLNSLYAMFSCENTEYVVSQI